MRWRDDARAVRIRDEHVVVLGQKTHRRRYRSARDRAARCVEQFAAAFVAVHAELRAQALDVASSVPAGPTTPARRRRWPVRTPAGSGRSRRRASTIRRSGRPSHDSARRQNRRTARSPEAARRNLDERDVVADRVAEHASRSCRGNCFFSSRPISTFVRGSASTIARPAAIIAVERRRIRLLVRPRQQALDDGANGQTVVGGHQVQCVAHQRDAHRLPVRDQIAELRVTESRRGATTARRTARSAPAPACRRGAPACRAPARAGVSAEAAAPEACGSARGHRG